MRKCFGTTEVSPLYSICKFCEQLEECKKVEPKTVRKKTIINVPYKKREEKKKVSIHQIDEDGEIIEKVEDDEESEKIKVSQVRNESVN